jgi:hypothetical protein
MRRRLARAAGLLIGYTAMCLGLRLLDVITLPLSLEEDWELTRGSRAAA